MIMAAHQPNFFPWLGYFNKIYRSDVFYILDDVQMVKTGSSWFNRCNFLIQGEARFGTVSVSRPSGTVLISEAKMNDLKWKKKLIGTLEMAYCRHPHYSENIKSILELIEASSNNLCDFNLSVIDHFIRLFELNETRICRSSELNLTSTSTQRLVDLVKNAGCDFYLEGGGATGYQDDSLFQASGINLIKQNFVHPTYSQRGANDFIPGLSILDPLFNCGVVETKKLIMAGIK